jgi:peptide/nickel transport system substrate-binding protein
MQGGKGQLVTAISSNVERLLLNRADPNQTVNGARSEPSTKHPFLSDLNVRKALAMACDRKTIAEQLYGGGLSGAATTNIVTAPPQDVSPNTAGMDIAQFDLAKANALLDQAGWTKGSDGIRAKNGVKMHIVYQTTINSVRQKTQDIIKQAWGQLGIQVDLKTVDAKIFFSSDAGNPDTASHFYTDVEMFTNGSDQPDPTNYLAGWTTKQIASKANSWDGNGYERYSNPAYDALYDQFLKETDPDKRKALIIKMNDLLVSDVVIIPLVARTSPTSGRSTQLQGVNPNPWDSELWNVGEWSKSG